MGGADPTGDFESGHLADARYVDLDAVLARPAAGGADAVHGRHPLPTAAAFARDLGALGIADEAVVVAYDRRGGALAGRLVWMLRVIGQRAALLDGGLGEWNRALETGAARLVEPVVRADRAWPTTAVAHATDVAAHIAAGGVVIDSRDRARYAGEVEPIDTVAGHVPGAINLVFTDNLGSDGRFRPSDELLARFAPIAEADMQPIVYCGSGVTACHNALAMEHVGLGLPRIYVGSWSGWSADPDRPIATGP